MLKPYYLLLYHFLAQCTTNHTWTNYTFFIDGDSDIGTYETGVNQGAKSRSTKKKQSL